MSRIFIRPIILVLALLLVALTVIEAWPGAAETQTPAPAQEQEKQEQEKTQATGTDKPVGLVGTLVAVVPASQTLVVDVPLNADVLRVGATATEKTKIQAGGKATALDKLEPGSRVRIQIRRVDTGNEALSVEVLGGPQG
jgi:hypothetical protein